MKKTLVGILMAAMVLSIGATSAFAAGQRHRRNHASINVAHSNYTGACDFVDADNDGICDNCDTYHGNCLSGSECESYADADGDGVCDNYASSGHNIRRGHGHRGGHHR